MLGINKIMELDALCEKEQKSTKPPDIPWVRNHCLYVDIAEPSLGLGKDLRS